MVFNDPVELAKLYQVMRVSDVIMPEDLTITTLDDVLFDSVKNDLSFRWKNQSVILMEHQSTWNENLPARMLTYVAQLLKKSRSRKRAAYRVKLDKLPAPHFYMFYLGAKPPKKYELRLSEAFREPSDDLELVCHVIDITYGRMLETWSACRPMTDYSYFVRLVEEKQQAVGDLDEAIRRAIVVCKSKDILSTVFDRYSEKEVADSMKFQWNADDARRYAEEEKAEEREEGRAEGFAEGRESAILSMIREHLPVESIERIMKLPSADILALAKKNGLAVE